MRSDDDARAFSRRWPRATTVRRARDETGRGRDADAGLRRRRRLRGRVAGVSRHRGGERARTARESMTIEAVRSISKPR